MGAGAQKCHTCCNAKEDREANLTFARVDADRVLVDGYCHEAANKCDVWKSNGYHEDDEESTCAEDDENHGYGVGDRCDDVSTDSAHPEHTLNAALSAFDRLDHSFKQQQRIRELSSEPAKKPMQDVLGREQKKLEQEGLKQLEGKWMQEATGAYMGEITRGKVVWDACYEHRPSKLKLAKGIECVSASADIELELNGECHRGRYEPNPKARVVWSDGEIWIHVATETEGCVAERAT